MNLFMATAPAAHAQSFWQAAGRVPPAGMLRPAGLTPIEGRPEGIGSDELERLRNKLNEPGGAGNDRGTAREAQARELVAGLGVASEAVREIGQLIRTGITEGNQNYRAQLEAQTRENLARLTGQVSALSSTDPAAASDAARLISQLQSELATLRAAAPVSGSTTTTGMSDGLKYGLIAGGALLLVGGILVIARGSSRGPRQNPWRGSRRRRRY